MLTTIRFSVFQICNEPYFYSKITEQEAEEMLSSMVKPGTFLVRRGESSKAFFLTVRAPEGGTLVQASAV